MIHDRRVFATRLAAVAAVAASPASMSTGKPEEPYTDPALVDRWMTQWMEALKATSGKLHMGRFADPVYYLSEEIDWKPDPGQKGKAVTVPVGFVTDFASIPRIFWTALRPDGLYTFPAILHDYLYWKQTVPRKEADSVFYSAMEEFRINKATIRLIYAAVRAAGWIAWNSNTKLREAGEKRVLKRFPDDPKTRWEDWKKDPAVFR